MSQMFPETGMSVSGGAHIHVALLTGGSDRPYVVGLTTALTSQGAVVDMIGSDELDCVELRRNLMVTFLNMRGSMSPDATVVNKIVRICKYYARLVGYAATCKPRLFHILWNGKLEYLDRTLLLLYYKLLGKRIVFTAHNVNAGKRDNKDSYLNRVTLRFQYVLCDAIFVHTDIMKRELIEDFGINPERITIVPFGMTSLPNTDLAPADARRQLGIGADEKTILFFGNIKPYKGLEYLVQAFHQLLRKCDKYRLIIAGRPIGCEHYWMQIQQSIADDLRSGRVLLRAAFIPDEAAEVYFKAADVLVLPYKDIYQSGVLFTGYTFGLPVVSADVGSLKEDIVEGKTGFVCRPENPDDLASTLERFFSSDLYENVNSRRDAIRECVTTRHTWELMAGRTMSTYADVLQGLVSTGPRRHSVPRGGHQKA